MRVTREVLQIRLEARALANIDIIEDKCRENILVLHFVKLRFQYKLLL